MILPETFVVYRPIVHRVGLFIVFHSSMTNFAALIRLGKLCNK